MKHKDYLGIIPGLYTGKELEAEASVDFENDNDAKLFYDTAKRRLLNVNNWHKVAGIISAQFRVFDNNGNESVVDIQKDDYIRVDIPGPGTKDGDGYDWVHVEELKEINEGNVQSIGFRVRPHANPLGDKGATAHFYSDESTSCFIILREDAKVGAMIIDRNIKPNDEAESVTDKIRHSAIGMMAINGFSKLQWKHLAEGLVERKK